MATVESSAIETGPQGARPARSRFCPSCGRNIDWNTRSCPYCLWSQDHPFGTAAYDEPISKWKRIDLYLGSLFIPILGIVIGILYMNKSDDEHKSVGKTCLIIGIISMFVMPILLAAVAYLVIRGT